MILRRKVPDHLVPSVVVVLPELPVTVNGKLDRAALPAPVVESAGRAASTPREQILCAVVAEVLGRDRVGVDEDFFGLGGDSITAISVSSRLRVRGVIIAPKELLAQRDLGTIAAAAREVAEDDNRAATVVDVATGAVIAPPIVRALTDKNPTDESISGYASGPLCVSTRWSRSTTSDQGSRRSSIAMMHSRLCFDAEPAAALPN